MQASVACFKVSEIPTVSARHTYTTKKKYACEGKVKGKKRDLWCTAAIASGPEPKQGRTPTKHHRHDARPIVEESCGAMMRESHMKIWKTNKAHQHSVNTALETGLKLADWRTMSSVLLLKQCGCV